MTEFATPGTDDVAAEVYPMWSAARLSSAARSLDVERAGHACSTPCCRLRRQRAIPYVAVIPRAVN